MQTGVIKDLHADMDIAEHLNKYFWLVFMTEDTANIIHPELYWGKAEGEKCSIIPCDEIVILKALARLTVDIVAEPRDLSG